MLNNNALYLKLFLFLNLYSFISGMELEKGKILLPTEQILLERLQPIKEYEHFFNNTTFIKDFAHQKKYAAEVFMVLGFNIEAYGERFKNNGAVFKLEMLKPKVVTLMLQDHPNAIAYLKKENVLAEIVQLPSEETLREQLKMANFDHLARHTQITQKLAHQEKYPTEIHLLVGSQIVPYAIGLGHPALTNITLLCIPKITKTILQQHPDAIQFLINEEILEKTDNV